MNPEQSHTPEPCNCYVERCNETYGDEIHYCPAHAAAPDLLAALQQFEPLCMSDMDASEIVDEFRDIARAAIAKAEGVQ